MTRVMRKERHCSRLINSALSQYTFIIQSRIVYQQARQRFAAFVPQTDYLTICLSIHLHACTYIYVYLSIHIYNPEGIIIIIIRRSAQCYTGPPPIQTKLQKLVFQLLRAISDVFRGAEAAYSSDVNEKEHMKCWGGYCNILGSVHSVRFKRFDRGLQLPPCGLGETSFYILTILYLYALWEQNSHKDRNIRPYLQSPQQKFYFNEILQRLF